jgi:catalase
MTNERVCVRAVSGLGPRRTGTERVAAGVGLSAPKASEPPTGTDIRAALSQMGEIWPVLGRQVGIVVGEDVDTQTVKTLQELLRAAGVVPLIVAPHGGQVGGLTAQRTFATATSVELDAVLVAGEVPPAPDARPTVDAKAGTSGRATDPLLSLHRVWDRFAPVASAAISAGNPR